MPTKRELEEALRNQSGSAARGPLVLDNPFFEESTDPDRDTSRAENIIKDADTRKLAPGTSTRILPGSGDKQNTDTARSILEAGTFKSEAQRKRLQQIVKVGERTEKDRARKEALATESGRKAVQGQADVVFRKIVEWGSDPDNDVSIGEFDQVKAEYQRKYAGAVLGNPIQIFKQKIGKQDPDVSIQHFAEDWGAKFNIPPSEIASMFEPGKMPTAEQRAKAVTVLQAGGIASGNKRAIVRDALKAINAKIERMVEDPVLFDDGVLREQPKVTAGRFDFGFTTIEQGDVKAYNTKKELFDDAVAKRDALEAKSLEFSEFNEATADPEVDAVAPLPPATNPLAAPEISDLLQPKTRGATPETAVEMGQGEDQTKFLEAAEAEAKRRGQSVWIRNPETGLPSEIKP